MSSIPDKHVDKSLEMILLKDRAVSREAERARWFLDRTVKNSVDVSPAVDHANDLRNLVCDDSIENHMWVRDDGT